MDFLLPIKYNGNEIDGGEKNNKEYAHNMVFFSVLSIRQFNYTLTKMNESKHNSRHRRNLFVASRTQNQLNFNM